MKNKMEAKQFKMPFLDVSTCSEDERLGTALSLLRSSHDPVFVTDAAGNFLGLLSLKYAIFQKRYPFTTKVKHCWQAAPAVKDATPIVELARHMMSTGLYTLPVFDDQNRVSGLVSAPVILRVLVKKAAFLRDVLAKVKVGKPQFARENITIAEAYNTMRRADIPRLLLVNKHGKATAIITRKDIERVLVNNHKKERISVFVGGNGDTTQVIEQGFVSKSSPPALEFASKFLVTVAEDTGLDAAVKNMVKKNVPSVLLVDKYQKPKGVISTHTILEAIANTDQSEPVQIIYHHAPEGPTKEYRLRQLSLILQNFCRKINKSNPVQRLEVTIEQPKNDVGKVTAYDVRLHIYLWSGKSFVASSSSFVARARHVGLESNVRMATRELKKQIEKNQGKLAERG